jgi:hypothetical protein
MNSRMSNVFKKGTVNLHSEAQCQEHHGPQVNAKCRFNNTWPSCSGRTRRRRV